MDTNVEKSTTLNNIEGKVVSIPLVDRTLTKPGKSADAKVVGDEIARLDGRVDNIDPHFAKNVQYDNAKSKLSATDIQNAVDEIVGFGFGGYAKGLANVSLNSVTKSGLYCCDVNAGVTNLPSNVYACIVKVSPFYNSNYVVQEAVLLDGQNSKLRRVCHNGVWQPWEWENPKSEVGIEYRTTERFNGKPVYIKRLSCGVLKGGLNWIGHGITNLREVVDFGGSAAKNGYSEVVSIPFHLSDTYYCNLSVTHENVVTATSSGVNDVAYYLNTQIWVKYTKTTD